MVELKIVPIVIEATVVTDADSDVEIDHLELSDALRGAVGSAAATRSVSAPRRTASSTSA